MVEILGRADFFGDLTSCAEASLINTCIPSYSVASPPPPSALAATGDVAGGTARGGLPRVRPRAGGLAAPPHGRPAEGDDRAPHQPGAGVRTVHALRTATLHHRAGGLLHLDFVAGGLIEVGRGVSGVWKYRWSCDRVGSELATACVYRYGLLNRCFYEAKLLVRLSIYEICASRKVSVLFICSS